MTPVLRSLASLPPLLGALVAAPVAAQAALGLPTGCAGELTIQHRGCLVTNVWTCEGDSAGVQHIGLSDDKGLFQVRTVDAEFQWLRTRHLAAGLTLALETPAPDPASLTELLEIGRDGYDFTMQPENGMAEERYVGEDRITGETEIDGTPLRTTEFSYEVQGPTGAVMRRREGRQYVSPEHRIFVLGESWDPETPGEVSDHRPVTFTYAGERGFLSGDPQYGCEATVAALQAVPAREATR